MNKPFDNNRDAAAQEYNRYQTLDSVTARDEKELSSIPESDLDIVEPTVRDDEGIQPVVSEEQSVNELSREERLSGDRHTIDLDTGVNATGQPLDPVNNPLGGEYVDNEVTGDTVVDDSLEDGPLPDIPDADELNGETPEDPSVPSSFDQDAHGTDLRNGSVGHDDPDVPERDRR
ncbi:hypothetical protein [Paenibacillus sp. WLX2291]|uniref:hypothetical protein n=1 Tax=Paenibacillus sp. WLX2291 TaxID=3296934 RepID=UPI003983F674